MRCHIDEWSGLLEVFRFSPSPFKVQNRPTDPQAIRRPGETIVVELPSGERISVFAVRIRGNQVRLSIEVPKYVTVMRDEMVE